MTRRARVDDLYRFEIPAELTISPDGKTVVYSLRTIDRSSDAYQHALWTVDVDVSAPKRLTAGPSDTSPCYSPDGTRIAFFRSSVDGAQVWILSIDSSTPIPLTDLPLGAGQPIWSPDGTRIAFTAPTDIEESGLADRGLGRRPQDPVVVDRLGYKSDGSGLVKNRRTHLFVVDVATGQVRQLTRGDWDVNAPAWSPDGTRLAFCAARDDDADLTLRAAAFVLAVDDVDPLLERVGTADGMAEAVSWTSAGDALLVCARATTRTGHLRIWHTPLGSSAARDLTANLDSNVLPGDGGLPQTFGGGERVAFCAPHRARSRVHAVDLADLRVRQLTGEDVSVLAGPSVASSADVGAVVVSTSSSYGEVALLDLNTGRLQVLSTHTSTALPDVDLFAATDRQFTSADGTVVHGSVIVDPDSPRPAPLLTMIHGGPHGHWSPVADDAGRPDAQELVSRGWAILMLNPPGSAGYGERHYSASVRAWASCAQPHLLEAIDTLIQEGLADADRLAVYGYSYGGYLACWLTTQTDRFVAAVAGAPVTDLVSDAGTSDMGRELTLRELEAFPHHDLAAVRAESPLEHVADVTTPTLLLHGLSDSRCPTGQSEQWFSALRQKGVPTRMVLYPDASHSFLVQGYPSHQADFRRRVVDWIEEHTPTPVGGHQFISSAARVTG